MSHFSWDTAITYSFHTDAFCHGNTSERPSRTVKQGHSPTPSRGVKGHKHGVINKPSTPNQMYVSSRTVLLLDILFRLYRVWKTSIFWYLTVTLLVITLRAARCRFSFLVCGLQLVAAQRAHPQDFGFLSAGLMSSWPIYDTCWQNSCQLQQHTPQFSLTGCWW